MTAHPHHKTVNEMLKRSSSARDWLLKTFSTTEEMLRLRIRSTIGLIQLGTRGCSFPTPMSCGYLDTVFARHRHRVQVRASILVMFYISYLSYHTAHSSCQCISLRRFHFTTKPQTSIAGLLSTYWNIDISSPWNANKLLSDDNISLKVIASLNHDERHLNASTPRISNRVRRNVLLAPCADWRWSKSYNTLHGARLGSGRSLDQWWHRTTVCCRPRRQRREKSRLLTRSGSVALPRYRSVA